jgi:hypothetical protein
VGHALYRVCPRVGVEMPFNWNDKALNTELRARLDEQAALIYPESSKDYAARRSAFTASAMENIKAYVAGADSPGRSPIFARAFARESGRPQFTGRRISGRSTAGDVEERVTNRETVRQSAASHAEALRRSKTAQDAEIQGRMFRARRRRSGG